MIIRITHTLTETVEEDSENWTDFKGTTKEELLNHITKYISEDPSYVIDSLSENGILISKLEN